MEYFNRENDAYTTSAIDDKSKAKKSDTRRPRITLRHLGRMRTIRRVKKFEKSIHRELVMDMYGSESEE